MTEELEKAWNEAYSIGPRKPFGTLAKLGTVYREKIDYSFVLYQDEAGAYWYESKPGDIRDSEKEKEQKESPEPVA